MTRKGINLTEYHSFLTERTYWKPVAGQKNATWYKSVDLTGKDAQWNMDFARFTLMFNFCEGHPRLEIIHIGPVGEYAEREEWVNVSVRLPISRDEFFGTFDLKEEALVKSAVSLLAHVYGNVNVPV